jgi:hypothetical protein
MLGEYAAVEHGDRDAASAAGGEGRIDQSIPHDQ